MDLPRGLLPTSRDDDSPNDTASGVDARCARGGANGGGGAVTSLNSHGFPVGDLLTVGAGGGGGSGSALDVE